LANRTDPCDRIAMVVFGDRVEAASFVKIAAAIAR
jgi:hypothetical protein